MIYIVSSVTAFLGEGEITDIFRRRKMQNLLNNLKYHYIVCGLGDTGRHAVEELEKTHTPYVVVESFFSSRRRHPSFDCDWSSDVCSSDLTVCDCTTSRPAPVRRSF